MTSKSLNSCDLSEANHPQSFFSEEFENVSKLYVLLISPVNNSTQQGR